MPSVCNEQQRSCAVGWRGVLCWERDAPTLSLFLPSAADNSKDLATELVHYGFIHEVRLLIRCATVRVHALCTVYHSSMMPRALFPICSQEQPHGPGCSSVLLSCPCTVPLCLIFLGSVLHSHCFEGTAI